VDVTGVEGLPAAVEVATYSVAAEALTNAAKHAAAAHVAVQVQHLPDALTVQVADDGRGIPADACPGSGSRPCAGARRSSADSSPSARRRRHARRGDLPGAS
jgi:hypothetical protein